MIRQYQIELDRYFLYLNIVGIEEEANYVTNVKEIEEGYYAASPKPDAKFYCYAEAKSGSLDFYGRKVCFYDKGELKFDENNTRNDKMGD